MPIRSKGLRSKTRHMLLKDPRKRGMLPPNRVLRQFEVGARVAIKNEPSQHSGMTHKRFQGLTGTVAGKQGEAFVIDIMHGNMAKTLVVRAEHLKALQ
ncbi:MAG: large subunit ribosomal protein L21e [Thermoplasmata archaeon]|jgi:large subunit ribosomal protein L21e|nr:large subunit ribosomal protein L21e [Thermoplasmata archaeon]